jgi:hypothetical protein
MEDYSYCRGYFYYEVKRIFENENNLLTLYGTGNFLYTDVKYKKAYDKEGNFIGELKTEKHYDKYVERKKLKENTTGAIQINYNFYKVKYYANTIDELSDFKSILEASNLIKSDDLYRYDKYYFAQNYHEGFVNKKDTYYSEPYENMEICYFGHSCLIKNTVYKKIYELDLKKYESNYKNFVKENPEHKNRVETIYMLNIDYLMRFWDVSKKKLFSKTFNPLEHTIKKLNRRITLKSKR